MVIDDLEAAMKPATCVVLAVMIAFSSVGNLLMVFLIISRPSMRSAINLLLANLAFTDVLVGCISLPLQVVCYYWSGLHHANSVLCSAHFFLWSALWTESTIMMSIICTDRWFILVKRQEKVSPRRAMIIIAVSWVLSLALSGIQPAVRRNALQTPSNDLCSTYLFRYGRGALGYQYAEIVLLCCLPIISIACAVLSISLRLRRNRLRVVDVKIRQPQLVNSKGILPVDYKFKTKTFYTITIMFCLYCVSSFPRYMAFWQSVTASVAPLSWPMLFLLIVIANANATLNPVVFYFRIVRFKEAFLGFLPAIRSIPLVSYSLRALRPSGAEYIVE